MSGVTVDRGQLEDFFDSMFVNATASEPDKAFVALRAFYDGAGSKVFQIDDVDLFKGREAVINAAFPLARRCAAAPEPVVFCPPIALFRKGKKAREEDIVQGLALSVECDTSPANARRTLESLLGPATQCVRSGGVWKNPETGGIEDKLHLHWRLVEPATGSGIQRLKLARVAATKLVGGDASNIPACHPIRWPGSIHSKGEPRLATIISTAETEIDLDAACELLGVEEIASAAGGTSHGPNGESRGYTNGEDWEPLLTNISAGLNLHESLNSLAAKMIASGMLAGAAVNILRAFMNMAPNHDERWRTRFNDIPRAVSTAEAKFRARQGGNGFEEPPGAEQDNPLPLFQVVPDAEPYPIENLGRTLSRVAKAIASKVQVPCAMSAQSILAVSALVSCHHADVMMPFGQTRPLTLFLATVAASGDRKTTSDTEALWPIRKHEANLREKYDGEIKEWRIDHAAWAAQKRKVEGEKLGLDERRNKLSELGEEPAKPLAPFLICGDPTIEGLTKNWGCSLAALGLFTSEGAQFTAGHGMSDEARAKTAAMLSELWDGVPIKRVRAMDDVMILPGRRLAMHIMIQPAAANAFLSNEALRDQGLLSRILVARPASKSGTRLYKEVNMDDTAAIKAYGARILHLLEAPAALAEGKRNELAPRAVPLSTAATAAWIEFHNHVEARLGQGGELEPIKGFAAKAAEEAAKIACIITIIEDLHAREISLEQMNNGIALAGWYLNEALRIQQSGLTDPAIRRAAELLKWLQAQPGGRSGFREILQFGPNPTRAKNAADDALAILAAHKWTTEISARPLVIQSRKGT